MLSIVASSYYRHRAIGSSKIIMYSRRFHQRSDTKLNLFYFIFEIFDELIRPCFRRRVVFCYYEN